MHLRFSFESLDEEIAAFAAVASEFLAPGAIKFLSGLREQLRGIQGAPTNNVRRWGISEATPISTIYSTESHNPRDYGLMARVCSVWEVTVPSNAPKIKNQPRYFELTGTASTRISFWKCVPALLEVARWTFEIADHNGPGCCIHSQVKGDDGSQFFPPTLSIPRLPGMLVTPVDALDYALGELFQDEWAQTIGKGTNQITAWSRFQRDRVKRILDWQRQELQSPGPAWSRLKRAKPKGDLFLQT
jgi:hypothetical protein